MWRLRHWCVGRSSVVAGGGGHLARGGGVAATSLVRGVQQCRSRWGWSPGEGWGCGGYVTVAWGAAVSWGAAGITLGSAPRSGGRGLGADLALDPAQHRHHAAQPQRGDGLGQAEAVRRVVRARASTSAAVRPSSPSCRMPANPRVVGASAGASKNRRTTRFLVGRRRHRPRPPGKRRLALVDLLQHRRAWPAYRSGSAGSSSLNSSSSCSSGRCSRTGSRRRSRPGRGAAGCRSRESAPFSIGTRTALPHSVHEPS